MLGLLTLPILAMLSLVTYLVYQHNRSTPVNVEETLQRFRSTLPTLPAPNDRPSPPESSPTGPTPSASTVPTPSGRTGPSPSSTATPSDPTDSGTPLPPLDTPAPGVYSYDTTGDESTDALYGSSHQYPATTTITVTPSPCGWQGRWDAIEERWNITHWCDNPGGMFAFPKFTEYHEFFGQSETLHFECGEGGRLPTATRPAGTTTTFECAAGDQRAEITARSLGRQVVQVGSTTHEAFGIQMDHEMTGPTTGSLTDVVWFEAQSGLIISRRYDLTSTSDSIFGKVHFEEHYEIRLKHMTPAT